MHNLRLKFFLHQLEGGGPGPLGPPLATPMPVATLMVRMICVGFQRRSVRRPYRGHMLLSDDKVILLTLLRLIMDKFVAVGSLYWI